jgi:hypothetical protein
MIKLPVGTWVSPKSQTLRGIVRGHKAKNFAMVCWLGRKKAQACLDKTLRKSSPPRALILEGSLDNDLASQRSEEDLLRTWLQAEGVPVAYKNVHALSDFPILVKGLGKNRPPFVHISCHGDHDEHGRPYIVFAPKPKKKDRVYLDDPATQQVFCDAFSGLPIFFAACLLGKYQSQLETFKCRANLTNVAGFTRVVYDSEAMIFELLLYHGVLINGWNFVTAVNKACDAMMAMNVLGTKGKAQKLARVV